MEYYVFISNDCNLNCEYCSIMVNCKKENIPNEPIYKLYELFKFITHVQLKYNNNEAKIIFFGGEPTLNYKFILNIIEYANNHSFDYTIKFMLHTNGLLLNNIPLNILKNLEMIMLSINYDKIPKYNLYNGYFKSIADGILFIKRLSNIPIIARLTITEETSLYTAVMQIHPFVDYLYWQLENCYKFDNYDKFYNSYKYELNLLMDTWMKYLKKGILLRFIPFIANVNFLNNKMDTIDFCCGYNTSMIYIQTNGNCFTCAEDFTSSKNYIGSIYTDIQFSDFSLCNTICLNCEYKNICKGRCGRMHREFDDSHIVEYCNLNKIQFDFFKENFNLIMNTCKENNISIEMTELFSYTEYTP